MNLEILGIKFSLPLNKGSFIFPNAKILPSKLKLEKLFFIMSGLIISKLALTSTRFEAFLVSTPDDLYVIFITYSKNNFNYLLSKIYRLSSKN